MLNQHQCIEKEKENGLGKHLPHEDEECYLLINAYLFCKS